VRNVFVSYAHQDRPLVGPLAQHLRKVGMDVWLDSELAGGQVWWDKILYQIRTCDVLIAAVSKDSLNSDACRSERNYAASLGKSVLPLAIETVPTAILPLDIARLQIIDYTQPGDAAAFQLVGAILGLPPTRPLPSPLPVPPALPMSYIHDLAEQVALPSLNLDQQLAVIGKLESALDDPGNRDAAVTLLQQMAVRQDLYAAPARRLDVILKDHKISSARPAGRPKADSGTTKQARPTQQAQTTQPSQTGQPQRVKPHWGMALWALILFFPTGIPALVFAARVQPSAATGDLPGARRYSKRVVVLFWVSLVAIIFVSIIVSAAGGGTNSNGALATGLPA